MLPQLCISDVALVVINISCLCMSDVGLVVSQWCWSRMLSLPKHLGIDYKEM